MSESDELSQLIGLIYDAALDASLWLPALEGTAAFLRSATATLGSFDTVQSNLAFNFSWGDDPAYTAIYVERYARLNPLIPASQDTEIGAIYSTASAMTHEAFYETRVYQEWARPQGYVDAAQVTLEKSGTALAVLVAVRHESVGRVDDEMRRRMALLAPHFRRAVLIGKIIDLKTIAAAAFAETIDGLAAGVFLVDRDARIIHANPSGSAMLDDGEVVKRIAGRLGVIDGNAHRDIAEAIAVAGDAEAKLGGLGTGIALSGPTGERYVAHVLPLASGVRRSAAQYPAAIAAVFVRRPALDLTMPVASAARRYRLTPTEARVLRAVVEHGGIAPIAATLGITEATVKTHVQRLFEKTGTNRQVDLVKLTYAFTDTLDR